VRHFVLDWLLTPVDFLNSKLALPHWMLLWKELYFCSVVEEKTERWCSTEWRLKLVQQQNVVVSIIILSLRHSLTKRRGNLTMASGGSSAGLHL